MGNGKILVVDDSATKRALYRELLEKEGYSVVDAQDGDDGLKRARIESPDAIVADIAMPKMNGFEMVAILKKDDRTKYIPVICVTATYRDLKTKLKALIECGAEEFFYMPENLDELLIKLRVVLRIGGIYAELLEKNKQLRVFNDAAVGRELKMVELKGHIKKLEEELAKYKK